LQIAAAASCPARPAHACSEAFADLVSGLQWRLLCGSTPPRELSGRRRNPLLDREIFDWRSAQRSKAIRDFENIPVNLVAGQKKIEIGDFRLCIAKHRVFMTAIIVGATEMNLPDLTAGRGGARRTSLVRQSYVKPAAICRF